MDWAPGWLTGRFPLPGVSQPHKRSMNKMKKFILPGTALLVSFYGSLVLGIGAIIGYIGTEIFCKKYIETKKVKMVIFNVKNWEVHLHHWLTAGAFILSAYFFGFINSIPVLFVGILGGLVFHDIHTDKKFRKNDKSWYHIVYKK